jgi:hypothetical protein
LDWQLVTAVDIVSYLSTAVEEFFVMSKRLDSIRGDRGANNVLNAALFLNAVLTFMFGFAFLHPMFNFVGVTSSDPFFVVFQVIGGVFLVIVTDASFYAWGFISRRVSNTSDQIVTAQSAKKHSLAGSLAASAGAIALLQTAVDVGDQVRFVVSLVAVAAGAVLAIAHVYWWDKYRKESSEFTELEDTAEDNALRYEDERVRNEELTAQKRKEQQAVHALEVQKAKAEFEIRQTEIEEELALQKDMTETEIRLRREVSKQVRAQVAKERDRIASKVVKEMADRTLARHLAGMGVNPTDYMESKNGR